MRITLVIYSLGRGGAERTLSVLAGAWSQQGRKVTVITFNDDEAPAYPLHTDVALRSLRVSKDPARNIFHALYRNALRIWRLRNSIRQSQPDVVISFMDFPNIITLLATQGQSTPVIITEHVHPDFYDIGWPWETLRRRIYHRANALVCVSRPVSNWFQKKISVKGFVVPNPVDRVPLSLQAHESQSRSNTGYLIVGMGRLVAQKGFDLLIEAFAHVAARHSNWSVKIMGDGPSRNELETQVQKLNLTGRVEFTGALADPFALLRVADLFVFPSRFEGFGNALCEAMACGLPAISFDCPSGPGDIIRHEEDGLLVPVGDVTALAVAMDELMSNPDYRQRLAKRAPEVAVRFSLERILGLWDQLFRKVMPEVSDEKSAAVEAGQQTNHK
ncbi:MAG TPA: glycosyltransferase family 4 protein [Candidatus Angelobacter sp.]|jgi:glycosyltransferase involved in cell wall biosynthesis